MQEADGAEAEGGLETGMVGREAMGTDGSRCSTCSQSSVTGNGRMFVQDEQPWVQRADAIGGALANCPGLVHASALHWDDRSS